MQDAVDLTDRKSRFPSGYREGYRPAQPSEQVLELLDCQAGVAHNRGHGLGVDWVVPRNHDLRGALRHKDVFPLAVGERLEKLP